LAEGSRLAVTRDPNLDAPRVPGKKDRRVHHDWRRPAAHVAERVIDELEGQLEDARDELLTDLWNTAKRLRCAHYSDGGVRLIGDRRTVAPARLSRGDREGRGRAMAAEGRGAGPYAAPSS
jgi:hypothetical protein